MERGSEATDNRDHNSPPRILREAGVLALDASARSPRHIERGVIVFLALCAVFFGLFLYYPLLRVLKGSVTLADVPASSFSPCCLPMQRCENACSTP